LAVTEESSIPKTNVIGTEEFGYKTIIQQKVYKKENIKLMKIINCATI
jgi:hypothetical protein